MTSEDLQNVLWFAILEFANRRSYAALNITYLAWWPDEFLPAVIRSVVASDRLVTFSL